MPSPFPGMDPYLERPDYWSAIHGGYLIHLQEQLNGLLLPTYTADLEVSLYVDRLEPRERRFAVGDAAVTGDPLSVTPTAQPVAGPVQITLVRPRAVKRPRRWLTIRDNRSREVVTVIELLSPANKLPGADRRKYLAKRDKILASRSSLIEIDLLRVGLRMPGRGVPRCAYSVLVSRPADRPRVDLWPIGLRDPLPAVPVPLRPGEPEPLADLRKPLDRIYDGGGYRYKIYDTPPEPPLSPEDAAWAASLVPPHG
jgi:hypothetical protein